MIIFHKSYIHNPVEKFWCHLPGWHFHKLFWSIICHLPSPSFLNSMISLYSGERESSPWLSSLVQMKFTSISLKFPIFARILSSLLFTSIVLSQRIFMTKNAITKMYMMFDKKNHFIRCIFFIVVQYINKKFFLEKRKLRNIDYFTDTAPMASDTLVYYNNILDCKPRHLVYIT